MNRNDAPPSKVPVTPQRFLCAASYAYGEGSTSWHRVEAIRALGHDVTFVDTTPPLAVRMGQFLPMRVIRKLFGLVFDWGRVNQRLLQVIATQDFDVLWIDKGTLIKASVFRAFRARFPKGKILGYSPDDMMVSANQSALFLASLPFYNVYFTTKSFHLTELAALGCPKVSFIDNAYQPEQHYPMEVTEEDRQRLGHSVIFIGAYEKERAGMIRYLAENGVSVRVWGDHLWKKVVDPPPLMHLECTSIYAEEYARAISASDICLCFLRKLNRDLQTTRSIEIPACGTFMVAERTDEHLSLFADGKEAVFFDTKEELLERVRYYLAHPEEREAIAAAGYRRCIEGGYSNVGRMEQMLAVAFADEK